MKNMRKLLSLLLIALLAVALLAGCGGNSSNSSSSEPAEEAEEEPAEEAEEPAEEPAEEAAEEPAEEPAPVEKVPGQVIVGTTTEANGDWSYATWTNNATDNTVETFIDDCLTVTTDLNGDYVVNDSVVENMEIQDNGDTKTWTITIKDGLKWNTGDPIEAKDFLTWSVFTCSPLAKEMSATTASYNAILGGKPYREGEATCVEGLRLIDDKTISITVMATGYDGSTVLPYYYDLANAALRAVDAEFWFGEGWTVADDGEGAYLKNVNDEAATLDDKVKENIEKVRYQNSDRVSAGPYYLAGYDTSSYQITLKKNENYCGNFEGQKPDIETIIIMKTEDDTVMDMLATGQIDILNEITDGNDVNAALDLIDNGTIDSSYVRYDRAGYGKIIFMCDFGPTQYQGVRHAIAHLLDRVEFANTFCAGWGSVINGPYGTAFTMAQDSEDLLAEKLDTYEYRVDAAIAALEEAGFTLGENGEAYESGIRYKEVTEEEIGSYPHCIDVNGKKLMPCILEWACSEGNSVSDLIATMLQENPDLAAAGIQINRTIMTFPELLNYMYRQDVYGVGGQDFTVPKYNMMNLATGWNSAVYDMSYEFTTNEEYLANGYNNPHIYDEELDKLSMDMVYGVEAGDYETYLQKWQDFIIRWNEVLPELPLYSNVYVTVYPNTIENYNQTSFCQFEKAILYAKYVG